MKKILFVCLALGFSQTSISQYSEDKEKDEDPKLYYDIISEIEQTNFQSIRLNPVGFGYQGDHSTLGLSVGIDAHDILKRFSVRADYALNYFYFNQNSDPNFTNQESIGASLKGNSLDFVLGVGFYRNVINKEESVTLSGNSNSSTITFVPSRSVVTYEAVVGLKNGSYVREMGAEHETTFEDFEGNTVEGTIYDQVQYHERLNMLQLGVKYRKTTDSQFKFTTYGKKELSMDQALSVTALIPMNKDESAVFTAYPGVSDRSMTPAESADLLGNLKYLSTGLNISYVASPFKSGLTYGVELGLYPGYWESLDDRITIGLHIGYRIMTKY